MPEISETMTITPEERRRWHNFADIMEHPESTGAIRRLLDALEAAERELLTALQQRDMLALCAPSCPNKQGFGCAEMEFRENFGPCHNKNTARCWLMLAGNRARAVWSEGRNERN